MWGTGALGRVGSPSPLASREGKQKTGDVPGMYGPSPWRGRGPVLDSQSCQIDLQGSPNGLPELPERAFLVPKTFFRAFLIYFIPLFAEKFGDAAGSVKKNWRRGTECS